MHGYRITAFSKVGKVGQSPIISVFANPPDGRSARGAVSAVPPHAQCIPMNVSAQAQKLPRLHGRLPTLLDSGSVSGASVAGLRAREDDFKTPPRGKNAV